MMENSAGSAIPSGQKKLIRAVLLTKRGMPLNQFQNDYISLEGRPFAYHEFGFPTLRSALESIPDTVRFEYAEKAKTWIVYGIAEPDMFMSSFTRIKQYSDENAGLPERKRRNRSRTKSKCVSTAGELVQNARGLYSIIIKSEGQFLTLPEMTAFIEKEAGIAESHCLELPKCNFLFYRYRTKEDAERVINRFNNATFKGVKLVVKPAEEKVGSKEEKKNNQPRRNDTSRLPNGNTTDHSESTDQGNLAECLTSPDLNDAADDDSPPPLVDDSSEDDDGPPPLIDDSDEGDWEETGYEALPTSNHVNLDTNLYSQPSIGYSESTFLHKSAFHRYNGKM